MTVGSISLGAVERISLLVTVKAYPALSQTYGEAVCVAGIRTDTAKPEWVRLFPVQYRDMAFDHRFKKYQLISVAAARHGTDQRPETLRPDVDTLELGELIDPKKRDGWERRREIVEPLIIESMCMALAQQRENRSSLAAFRPGEVFDLVIAATEHRRSSRQDVIATQPSLLFQKKASLEEIPFTFHYHYKCSTSGCPGHKQSMIDWEIQESYRSWRRRYDSAELLEKIRETFLVQMCGPKRDTVFFVGNQHLRPKGFMVLGVFWPPTTDA